jgi:hypothetical protein
MTKEWSFFRFRFRFSLLCKERKKKARYSYVTSRLVYHSRLISPGCSGEWNAAIAAAMSVLAIDFPKHHKDYTRIIIGSGCVVGLCAPTCKTHDQVALWRGRHTTLVYVRGSVGPRLRHWCGTTLLETIAKAKHKLSLLSLGPTRERLALEGFWVREMLIRAMERIMNSV